MFRNALLAVGCCFATTICSAGVLLSEEFDDVTTLAGTGWIQTNNSSPLGSTGWYQGVPEVFPSYAGAPNSYIAANFNNAASGGTIENWLITPQFSTATATRVSFFARAEILEPYFDQIAFGANVTGDAALGNFILAPRVTLGGGWTQYSVDLGAMGAGSMARFAIQYAGNADDSDFIGIDSFTVSTRAAVPEPSTLLLALPALLVLVLLRRRAAAVGAGLLLAAATSLPAMAQSTPGDSGDVTPFTSSQMVVRDPTTGELRAPTAAEAQALQVHRRSAASAGTLRTLSRRHADGAHGVRLSEEFMNYSVVIRQPDGRLLEYCFESREAAEAAMKGPSPAVAKSSDNLPTE
jgi:hypothetical protein